LVFVLSFSGFYGKIIKMKQHITLKQLNELSEKGKKRLKKWWKPKEGDWVYTPDWYEDEPIYAKDANWDYGKIYDEDGKQIGISAPTPEIKRWKKVKQKGYEWLYGITDEDGDLISVGKADLPLLSIGQMIEFLDENVGHPHWEFERSHGIDSHGWEIEIWGIMEEDNFRKGGRELCDALWEAVKELLLEK